MDKYFLAPLRGLDEAKAPVIIPGFDPAFESHVWVISLLLARALIGLLGVWGDWAGLQTDVAAAPEQFTCHAIDDSGGVN